MAISGDTAVVGAVFEDAGGIHAGAAYVFDLLLSKPTATQTPTATGTPTNTPTPPPPPLGGSGVFPDVPGAGGSSGRNNGVVAGVLAAVTAGALALGGAAWYARRRHSSL